MEQSQKINYEDWNFYLKYRLVINLIVLSFFLFLHCFFGFMIYVIFALLLLLIVFDSLQNAITYLVFYYPFCMLDISINEILLGVLIGAFLIKYVIKTYFVEKSKPDWLLLTLIVIFFIYCLLPIGPYSVNTFSRLVSFIGVFLALSIAMKNPDMIRFKYNVKMLAIALVVASLFALTYYFSPFLSEYLSLHAGRFKALFSQPDTLAAFCVVICSIFVYYIISEKASTMEVILFVALTIIGLFTFGKTFLLLMLIEYLAIFFYGLQKDWKKTLLIAGILALLAVIVGLIGHNLVEKYFNRFLNGEHQFDNFEDFLNVITTYRYELWALYVTDLVNNPLTLFFGAGIGTGPIGPRQLGAHNMYISMIYQLGIVGSIMFIGILVYMLCKMKQKSKTKINHAIVVPILVCGALFFVEDIIFYMNVI